MRRNFIWQMASLCSVAILTITFTYSIQYFSKENRIQLSVNPVMPYHFIFQRYETYLRQSYSVIEVLTTDLFFSQGSALSKFNAYENIRVGITTWIYDYFHTPFSFEVYRSEESE